MEETKKYLQVLNMGYGGFAPVTLEPDYQKSLGLLQERLEVLESLNFETLLDEANKGNGKAFIDVYQRQYCFLRHIREYREMLQPDYGINGKEVINENRLFRVLLNGADKFRADGLWSDEQWKEYKWTLCEIEKALEDRLREFAFAYGYSLEGDKSNGQGAAPEPQQKDLEYYCQKAVEKGYLKKVDGGYRKVIWTKAQLAYFLGHFLKPDGTFPDDKYCIMFTESRLSKALSQLANNKIGDGKPREYEIVDSLLHE